MNSLFSFCQRKFRFTSVLLEHLRTHTSSVNNIVEMKMKIWVNGRKLKCTEKGCKKKHAYTLEYTKHRDEHSYVGLNCAICNRPQPGPADYAAHMAAEHPTELSLQVFSQFLASYILSTSNNLGRIPKFRYSAPFTMLLPNPNQHLPCRRLNQRTWHLLQLLLPSRLLQLQLRPQVLLPPRLGDRSDFFIFVFFPSSL